MPLCQTAALPHEPIERPDSPLRLDPAHVGGRVPEQLHVPQTSMFYNLEVSARRFPDKTAIQFFGAAQSYRELLNEVEQMAGHLQHGCGIRRGDRVLIFSQNCPQFIAAFFAILRAAAVFVPVNAMLLEAELRHIVTDSGAVAAFVAQELVDQIAPLLGATSLQHLIVHAYGDAVAGDSACSSIPDWVRQTSGTDMLPAHAVRWREALANARAPRPHSATADDLCMLPYTSGTTGLPKACMHTHRTVMTSVIGSATWRGFNPDTTALAVAPLFHLLAWQAIVNPGILAGATIVLLPRWDREAAATLIERHRVNFWAALPAMVVDFFTQPGIETYDLSSLTMLGGGGAALPEATNRLLEERYGLRYAEGYGLTETASFACANPLHKLKRNCLGVPTFGVDVRLLDPDTLEPVPRGEVGEIVMHAAQVMLGYWNNARANAEAFIVIDGKRFLRTGDLASMDEDGYLFMRDRLKRMINASGYKVWPAEVEAMMYDHPAIQEACVIASPDAHRGETVKAVVCLKPGSHVSSAEILAWCRETMATYKAPRIVEIIDSLPRSATGKIAWRELQDREKAQVNV